MMLTFQHLLYCFSQTKRICLVLKCSNRIYCFRGLRSRISIVMCLIRLILTMFSSRLLVKKIHSTSNRLKLKTITSPSSSLISTKKAKIPSSKTTISTSKLLLTSLSFLSKVRKGVKVARHTKKKKKEHCIGIRILRKLSERTALSLWFTLGMENYY